MEEKSEYYAIPANYTDSGRLLGGMVEPRNAVEALILLVIVGYPELMLIPIPGNFKIVVMTVSLIPLLVVSLMGINGDSLFQYIGHVMLFWKNRRKLTFRRVGERDEEARKQKEKD